MSEINHIPKEARDAALKEITTLSDQRNPIGHFTHLYAQSEVEKARIACNTNWALKMKELGIEFDVASASWINMYKKDRP